jgi:hypothetical protein
MEIISIIISYIYDAAREEYKILIFIHEQVRMITLLKKKEYL